MAEDEQGGRGSLAVGTSTGRKRRILATLEQKENLWKQLEENDDATLERHCQLWEERKGIRVSVSTMSRGIRNSSAGPTKKTASIATMVLATARDGGLTRKKGLVSFQRLLGATERDEQARSSFRERRNWDKNVTLISSITSEGMGASMSIEGPSDTESFSL
jgi:hypothetical protein